MNKMKTWGLKEKILFTLAMVLVYRIGVAIPIPFIDAATIKQFFDTQSSDSIVNSFMALGGAFKQLGILSLGVMPYITASIIMQLLKVVVPKINEMYKSDTDRQTITQWTRYLTILFALMQAGGIILAAPTLLGFNVFVSDSPIVLVIGTFTIVIGALISMRIGEEITLRGVGNGVSLLIFASILVNIPQLINTSYEINGIFSAAILVAVLLAILALVVFVEKSEYRVPVTYTKSSNKNIAKTSTLPIKVALVGVLPVIFASSVIMVPSILRQFFPTTDWIITISDFFAYESIPFVVAFVVLNILLAFFAIEIVFDADKTAKDIRIQGGFVDGVRPGKATEKYLSTIAYRMTAIGAIYLSLISVISFVVFPLLGASGNHFTATSIIIVSTVVVTFVATIDAERSKEKVSPIIL